MTSAVGVTQPRVGAVSRASDFDRLATLRLPLALSLLLLHNDRNRDFSGAMQASPALADTVHFVAFGLGAFRVPTFFLIAGYLFFRSFAPTVAGFRDKIGSRVRSVLVPLVAWNLVGLVLLGLAQRMPALAASLNAASGWNVPVTKFSLEQLAAALVGGSRSQPLVYPLWFLRDLFTFVLLTPLIFAAVTVSRGAVTALLIALWFAGVSEPFVSPEGLVFFFIGCHVGLARGSLFALDAQGPVAALGWLALQFPAVDALLPASLVLPLRAVCGVLAVLSLSGVLARNAGLVRRARRTEAFATFLFLAHEPLLTATRRGVLKLLHDPSPTVLLCAYFGVVALVVGLLLGVFLLARRVAPRLLGVMTGGRSERPVPRRP